MLVMPYPLSQFSERIEVLAGEINLICNSPPFSCCNSISDMLGPNHLRANWFELKPQIFYNFLEGLSTKIPCMHVTQIKYICDQCLHSASYGKALISSIITLVSWNHFFHWGNLWMTTLPEFSLFPTIVWQANLHDSGFFFRYLSSVFVLSFKRSFPSKTSTMHVPQLPPPPQFITFP